MDQSEHHCWLDWWANPSTCLASVEVSVAIIASPAGWQAHGQAVNDEDRDGFAFLCDLDPIFTLRFPDDSTIPVAVRLDPDHRQFSLTEYTGPVTRPIDYTIDLQREPSADHP